MISDKIEIGSDNVFKDIGYDDPEERHAKSELVRKINAFIDKNRLTQDKVSKLIGMDKKNIKFLRMGIVNWLSLEQLVCILSKLNK